MHCIVWNSRIYVCVLQLMGTWGVTSSLLWTVLLWVFQCADVRLVLHIHLRVESALATLQQKMLNRFPGWLQESTLPRAELESFTCSVSLAASDQTVPLRLLRWPRDLPHCPAPVWCLRPQLTHSSLITDRNAPPHRKLMKKRTRTPKPRQNSHFQCFVFEKTFS